MFVLFKFVLMKNYRNFEPKNHQNIWYLMNRCFGVVENDVFRPAGFYG